MLTGLSPDLMEFCGVFAILVVFSQGFHMFGGGR